MVGVVARRRLRRTVVFVAIEAAKALGKRFEKRPKSSRYSTLKKKKTRVGVFTMLVLGLRERNLVPNSDL